MLGLKKTVNNYKKAQILFMHCLTYVVYYFKITNENGEGNKVSKEEMSIYIQT